MSHLCLPKNKRTDLDGLLWEKQYMESRTDVSGWRVKSESG